MRIISLRLHEWRCYEECKLEFPDGLIGIQGPNGVGKSTLIEAVGWALFGRPRPGAKIADLRRQGAPHGERSFVELVFQLDSTIYRVERAVGSYARLWIGDSTDPETTKSSDTNRRIALELDLTWDIFQRTVFAQQKDIAALDPRAGADERRRHVERLLGLVRYRLAAERARGDAKGLRQEVQALRQTIPDIKELAEELQKAKKRAAEDDPAVSLAKKDLEKSDVQMHTAKKAFEKERERVERGKGLSKDIDHAGKLRSNAEASMAKLTVKIKERTKTEALLKKMEPKVAKTDEARTALDLWNKLEEASRLFAEAEEELLGLDHDPTLAKKQESHLNALREERSELQRESPNLTASIDQLGRRVAALREVRAAGLPSAHEKTLSTLEHQHESAMKEVAVLKKQLAEDKAHFTAVRQGGPDTLCPVCRKAYGPDYDEILAAYERQIDEGTQRFNELETHLHKLFGNKALAKEKLERSKFASNGLRHTTGPSELTEAVHNLSAMSGKRKELDKRLAAVETQVKQLEPIVSRQVELGREWRELKAICSDRSKRLDKATAALVVKAYSADKHQKVRDRCQALTKLEGDAIRLQGQVAVLSDLERDLAAEKEKAETARNAEIASSQALSKLALKPELLGTLKRDFTNAEKRRDRSREHHHAIELAAQERSGKVRELSERLSEAESIQAEIEKRVTSFRQHDIVANLLERYRDHQAQRAWPRLEQVASELFAASTDGRYADIRLSEDYRLTITDRGEEHLLSRYSGGEQDLANLCLRLAIADWVARERGTELGFVILDEVFGSQDTDRRERIVEQLRRLAGRFRQVIVITHVAEISELCEQEIDVSLEEEGKSRAELMSH